MTAEATELRLGLAARAENLALVRQALSGFGDAIALGEETLADLKQIATEACMNAVVHAYPGEGEGRVDVTALANSREVELTVRDWGIGFHPRPAEPEGSLRLGLPLIATVADSFQIASPADGGTELTAQVRIADGEDGEIRTSPAIPAEAEMAITAGASARPVIARVLAIAATRAGFSLERMSDGVLLGDAIAAGETADFEGGTVGMSIEECGPNLSIKVGPLAAGGGQRLVDRMQLPGLGVSITKLARRVEVETDAAGEHLVVEIMP